MPKYVSSAKVREVFDIAPETLRGWAIKGKIDARAISNPGGRRTWLYDIESIGRSLEPNVDQSTSSGSSHQQRSTIIYCRVSSKFIEHFAEESEELFQKFILKPEKIKEYEKDIDILREPAHRLGMGSGHGTAAEGF